MDTSQEETLSELKRRLAEISAAASATAPAGGGTAPGGAKTPRTAPGPVDAKPDASKPARRRKPPAKTPDAFKEDGFGEEAPADEPWAEPGTGGSGSKRGGKKSGRGRQGWGQQDAEADQPEETVPLTPEEAYAEAKAIVLRQLTASPKSRRQLETKLAEKEIPPEAAAAVLDRFEEVQLVDDAEFARLWVRSRSQSKSLARGALRRELTEKGIAPDLAAEALEQVSADDELEAARALARKKLQASADLSDRGVRDKQTRRLVGMLARKGYSPSLGFRVAAEVIGEGRDARGDSV
ncbi:regulatory protein RecX [Arthrobacter sp. zg-Y1110]|uniref:regulatory protein RecX n=1 Tax=Arthrobacter sp. zg-Y1110 TaxID=2886932 RepID=UPI0027E172C3|nr:regulatory protein RecX [Arthrobacter sp. zg-Y1110]